MFTVIEKKRGRPCKFTDTTNALIEKKQKLFSSNNSKSEYMSLINLAYHTNKISQEEYNIAIYIENLHNNIKKILEVKTIPSATPYTWKKQIHNKIISTNQQDYSIKTWQKIINFLEANTTESNEFIKLVCDHHTYEELLALKTNQKVMNILKQGLKAINKMFRLG